MEISMKALSSFEVVKNDRTYIFIMPGQCPAGEAYDALFEFMQKVLKLSQENAKLMERKEEQKDN